jgi:hypothetical protein
MGEIIFTFEYRKSFISLYRKFEKKDLPWRWVNVTYYSLIVVNFMPIVIWSISIWKWDYLYLETLPEKEPLMTCIVLVVFTVDNVIFCSTILRMWQLLSNRKFMRKNECSMIVKFGLSILSTLTLAAWLYEQITHNRSKNTNNYYENN